MRFKSKAAIALGVVSLVSLVTLLAGVACAGTSPTATPIPPAQPAQPQAPTPIPQVPVGQPTAAPAPTSVSAVPTPTKVLPTATPVASDKPQYGGTLRFALSRGFDNFDPAYQIDVAFRRVLHVVYNSMVQMMPDGTINPEIAKSWSFSPDGKTVTFNLQSGIKFHDGTALDADAVKWTYDRYLDPKVSSPRRSELQPPLSRVEVVDSQTVRFQLTQPFRPLLVSLTVRPGHIASPTAIQKANSYDVPVGDFGRKPVGSGPFVFKEWVPGDHIDVVKNDKYWEKDLPYLDAIRYYIITDRNTVFAMLRTGELDLMEDMIASDVPLANANPNLRMSNLEGFRNLIMYIRVSEKPWDNKALRQAMAYALDRDTMVRVLNQGLADPAYHPIARSHGIWYDPTITTYKYDVQKAKDKVAEAGYAKGFTYTQRCRSEVFELQRCEMMQVMFKAVGIDMQIQPYEPGSYFSDWRARKFNDPVIAGLFSRVDPHLNLNQYFGTKGSSNGTGGLNYSNLAFDKLIEDASGVYDIAKAKDMYKQSLQLMLDDSPAVFLTAEHLFFGTRNTTRNFRPRPDGEPRLRELWLSK